MVMRRSTGWPVHSTAGVDLDVMPVVRETVSSPTGRRLPASLLLYQVQNDILVRAAPLGRTRHRRRYVDHHRREEWRRGSVHASSG